MTSATWVYCPTHGPTLQPSSCSACNQSAWHPFCPRRKLQTLWKRRRCCFHRSPLQCHYLHMLSGLFSPKSSHPSVVYEADWLWCIRQINFSRSAPFHFHMRIWAVSVSYSCHRPLSSASVHLRTILLNQLQWIKKEANISKLIFFSFFGGSGGGFCLQFNQPRLLLVPSLSFTDSQTWVKFEKGKKKPFKTFNTFSRFLSALVQRDGGFSFPCVSFDDVFI